MAKTKTAAKKKKQASSCGCFEKANAALLPHGAMLEVSYDLRNGTCKCLLAAMRSDPKSRKKIPPVLANFCPFCGVKYPASSGPSVRN